MKAKKILEKIDYIPRWGWYLGSLFIAGPFGPFVVYLVLHALNHSAELEEKQESEETTLRNSDSATRRGDGYEVRTAKQSSAKASVRAQQDYNPIDPDAGLETVLRQGRLALRRIRKANDAIPDPILTAKIDSIEESCKQILLMLEQRPELLEQLRTFLRYYLPTTLKLLDARARLDDAGTAKGREIRIRIGSALAEVDKAFLNQVAALEEYRFVDLESEMDVLSEMLRSDGLLTEEETEPQGTVLGGH